MTLLVTGASGFIGGALARQLVRHGAHLRLLLRPGARRDHLVGINAEIVDGDLRDRRSLTRAMRGCDGLYHVAADYRLWARNPAELYASNVDGTVQLMEAALDAGIERIVYTSSVATLGTHPDGTPADEDTPASLGEMVGHYKRSKYLAEERVWDMIGRHALPAVIVNPSTPVGPGDWRPTPTGRMVRDAATGRVPAYVDTGLNIVHVEDVVDGHLRAWKHGRIGRRYVLGGEDMTLHAILAHIAEFAGRRPPCIRLPRSAVYPVAVMSQAWARLTSGPEPQATVDGLKMSRKKMYFSSARAQAELGYRFRPAVHALADAVRWFTRR